jgi:hypothetical protein
VQRCPIGAVLLGVLEKLSHPGTPWFSPVEPNNVAIDIAAERIGVMTFAELVAVAFMASGQVGPCVGEADEVAADAYRHVDQRRPIAEAIDDAFHDELHAPHESMNQEWWSGDARGRRGTPTRAFEDLTFTYASGEFAWNAVWTATTPPQLIHESLIGEWELPRLVGRWSLPIRKSRRDYLSVYTIHRPTGWASLVSQHPAEAIKGRAAWGLPGCHDELPRTSPLFELDSQHAAVKAVVCHRVPDWTSVAQQFDAVYLSWAGWITSEGYVDVDEAGTATMLRY